MMDKEPGYDAWLLDKVTSTLRRVDSGETALIEHEDAMQQIRARLKARFSKIVPSRNIRVVGTSRVAFRLREHPCILLPKFPT